jgi:outer membrane protein assembly factor BamB
MVARKLKSILKPGAGAKPDRLGFPEGICCVLGLSFCCIVASPICAADWPQWRGPRRDGHSAETHLLSEWPATGPRLIWQAHGLGWGFSTPSVAGDHIYLLGNEGLSNEFAMSLSAKDGRRLWSVKLGKVGRPEQNPNFPGARSTPTVDGRLLYALGSDGDLVCLQTASGKQRWRKHLVRDFAGNSGDWAYAESPLIDGDALICTPGGSNATMIALNKHTGAVLWQCAMPEADAAGYASAVVAELSGVKQYVQFLAKGLAGVEAGTGRLLWRYGQTAKGAPGVVVTPIVSDGYVFSSTAVSGGALIQPVKKDGQFVVEEVYYNRKLAFDICGVVKVGEYLYGTAGPMTRCVEFKTGAIKWEERSKSLSWLPADGQLYAHAEDGNVLLLQPTADGYREKARFMPPNRPEHQDFTALTYPVLADGRLYIREFDSLWCYDVKARPNK